MRTAGKTALRAHLKSLSEGECRELILELWNRFPSVRDYFAGRFSPEASAEVLARAKLRIEREFSTGTMNPRGNPSVARATIAEFRRSQVRPEMVVELLIFYVRHGIEFVAAYGDDRPVRSIAAAFSDALVIAEKQNLLLRFRALIDRVVKLAESVPWGLGDYLSSEWLQFEPWDDETSNAERG